MRVDGERRRGLVGWASAVIGIAAFVLALATAFTPRRAEVPELSCGSLVTAGLSGPGCADQLELSRLVTISLVIFGAAATTLALLSLAPRPSGQPDDATATEAMKVAGLRVVGVLTASAAMVGVLVPLRSGIVVGRSCSNLLRSLSSGRATDELGNFDEGCIAMYQMSWALVLAATVGAVAAFAIAEKRQRGRGAGPTVAITAAAVLALLSLIVIVRIVSLTGGA